MTILILLAVVVSVITAVIAYKSSAGYLIKLILLPLYLMVAWMGAEFYTDQLGRPLYQKPPGEFVYIHHTVVGNHTQLVAHDGVSPRLYIFEATDEEEDGLKGAEQQTEEGVSVSGNFTELLEGRGELETWPTREPGKGTQ